MKRHLHAGEQIALGLDFLQQFKLVEIAVHIVERGDTVLCRMAETGCENLSIMPALIGCGCLDRVTSRRTAKNFAPPRGVRASRGAKAEASRSSPLARPSGPAMTMPPGLSSKSASASAAVFAQTT